MTEREAWISFNCFVQFGPQRFGLLKNYFGSAKKAFQTTRKELVEIGISDKLTTSFDNFRKGFDLSKYLDNLNKYGISVITLEDKEYPKRLQSIEDSPYILYVRKGENCTKNLNELSEISIAVVGARKMTSYGKDVTERLVTGLVNAGMTIISGLAIGIDAVSHRVCLENGGYTVGVLGNGLNEIYPPANKQLGEKIVNSGLGMLISEYPLGYPAMPQNFPSRNRIVSGIALGVLVIEGAEKSGTLLTASAAAAQGRDVFAVPGPITSSMSKAPNYLVKNGAKVVTSVKDILDELNVELRIVNSESRKVLPESEEEKKILEILEKEGLGVDSIVRIIGMDTGRILATLTTMELKGMVKNVGGVYIKA